MPFLNPQSMVNAAVGAALLLGGLIAAILAIRAVQAWAKTEVGNDAGAGRGDWENALAGYKNLRDQGVLSEEEYRKIRTLVEPHLQKSDSGGGQPPPDPAAERRAE